MRRQSVESRSFAFFKAGEKIGLVPYRTSRFDRAIENGLKPALKAHGLKLDEIADVKLYETPMTSARSPQSRKRLSSVSGRPASAAS